VETLRLRKIQPPHVQRLLEACIGRSELLPQGFYQIRDPNSVPRGLQRIVSQTTQQGRVWSCWTDGAETRLFICEMSLPLSRTRGTPVLEVSWHSQDGALRDSDTWTPDPEGLWRRSRDGDT